MPSGLPGSTTITARLVANTTGSPRVAPASTNRSIGRVSAEAYTSTGAPSTIWLASCDEAAKLTVTVTAASGSTSAYASAISVNASVSDAAAKTTISPPASSPVLPQADAGTAVMAAAAATRHHRDRR